MVDVDGEEKVGEWKEGKFVRWLSTDELDQLSVEITSPMTSPSLSMCDELSLTEIDEIESLPDNDLGPVEI